MINVTKPYLPNKKNYQKYLDIIWKNNHLTNFGLLENMLTQKLNEYLQIENLLLVNNGTIALQIAYRLANLSKDDEIITTPFSFIATINTALWEYLNIKFVDINKYTMCINDELVDKYITNTTKAILAVHVFGNPCNVENLQKIAKKNNCKLIYDGAHAFGVKVNGKNIFSYGDISTISFHATKIFHTIEGGAVISKNKDLINEAKSMINFGLKNNYPEILGINAKMSEFNAAMGLCILDDIDYIMEERQKIWEYYFNKLKDHFEMQKWHDNSNNNYHYFPILLKNENELTKKIKILNKNNIFPRRYFYPSLNRINFYNNSSKCNISDNISERIMCLPMYIGLSNKQQDIIIKHLLKK